MIRFQKRIKEIFDYYVLNSSFARRIRFIFETKRTVIVRKFGNYRDRIIKYWRLHAVHPFTDAAVFILGLLLMPIFIIIIGCDVLRFLCIHEPIWLLKVAFVFFFVFLYSKNALPEVFMQFLTIFCFPYIVYLIDYYAALTDITKPLQFVLTFMTVPLFSFYIFRVASPQFVRDEFLDPFGLDFYNRILRVFHYIFHYSLYLVFHLLPNRAFYYAVYWYSIIYHLVRYNPLVILFIALRIWLLQREDRFAERVSKTWFIDRLWAFVLRTARLSEYWPDQFWEDLKLFFFKIPHTYTYNLIVKSYYKIRSEILNSRPYNYINDLYQFRFKPFLLRYVNKGQYLSLPLKLTPDQVRRLPPGSEVPFKPVRITIAMRYRKFKKIAAKFYRVFMFNKRIYIFLIILITFIIFKIF